jgi:hypothetical protein
MADDPAGLSINLSEDIAEATSITKNIDQEVHVTTRDKVELALRRVLPRYTSTEQLVAALGVMLAFGVAVLTSDFRKFVGVSGEQWKALFILATGASILWFGYECLRWFRRPSMEDVVDEVLRSSKQV